MTNGNVLQSKGIPFDIGYEFHQSKYYVGGLFDNGKESKEIHGVFAMPNDGIYGDGKPGDLWCG